MQTEDPGEDAPLVRGDAAGDPEQDPAAPRDARRHAPASRRRRRPGPGYLIPRPSGRSAVILPSAISSSAIERGLLRSPVSTSGGTNSGRPPPSSLYYEFISPAPSSAPRAAPGRPPRGEPPQREPPPAPDAASTSSFTTA